MRVMVLLKGEARGGGAVTPAADDLAGMQRFNEDLADAGVLLAADGLDPTSEGVTVRFEDGRTTVLDGPFAEAKDRVAAYWLWQSRSLDEAVEWLRRAPFDGGTEAEIRPILGQKGDAR